MATKYTDEMMREAIHELMCDLSDLQDELPTMDSQQTARVRKIVGATSRKVAPLLPELDPPRYTNRQMALRLSW